ncbi:hypothetical protein CSV71_15605 [Sporosarcina sp. P21c]|uniref:hypothetical protein n=1 Tax=unclassified Sporosarcina TaxID=2647733 RepID=UPI000C16C8D3|nr:MULTISPECIES: hypothetical protein [unclassified Sporosarcina]PIC65971.1 hypothetical protein CSV78_15070 [Sporosarcina sp. P16a]PIC81890.1 hypothetical protein CSV73_15395 [Sporosarcina sp. P1]PIC88307.1 hypothetical protein CSV71_15605 [Sporosarcina sp. P21c]PIC91487.1 hypothetical protein CSV70_15500 [Sporosarcina sp. P25]
MKKYWKFTSIIAVIVLSIGTFYVSSANSATQFPEFVINKKSGNAEEIKSLELEGFYHKGGSMGYVNNYLKITSDGSDYRNGSSIIDSVIGHPAPLIQELQENYRKFMRGKGQSVDSFFVNKKLIAYAEVKYKTGSITNRDFKFDLSMVDKDTGHISSFTIEVPDSSSIKHMFVEDVQVVDNELHVITHNNTRKNKKYFNEKHIYSFDTSTGNINSNETVLSIPEQQDNDYTFANLIQTNPDQANEKLVFIKTQDNMIQEEETDRVEKTIKQLIYYNLKTKEKEVLELPGGLEEYQNSFSDGSTIYLSKVSEGNLVVTPYNIENGLVGKEWTIQLSNERSNEEPPIIFTKDGKLYVTTHITNFETQASITVIDLKTSDIIYQGEVIRKDLPKSDEQFEFYIFNMIVK